MVFRFNYHGFCCAWPFRLSLNIALVALLALPATLGAAPQIVVGRHAPCNLFNAGEEVRFEATLKGFPAGKTDVTSRVVDHFGATIWEKNDSVTIAEEGSAALAVSAGKLERGYYELKISAKSGATQVEGLATLGVMEFVNRTAKEAREGGYIFGLKWWAAIKSQKEYWEAVSKLGLQWTRLAQNENGQLTTAQILTDYPMNAVIKVERFPKELFDDVKYGPLEDWVKKYGRGSWTLKSLPKKEPYQKWLKEQLAVIPKEQQVFEIWNEPWDKMTPQDFASISQWIAEVILSDRPNAIIGPNLYGNTSPFEYDARVIKAGGLKGMKMVALHPYGTSENREWMRKYRQWLKDQLGRDMEIYITEYGSHSTPEGPAKRSELEQSRRVVRQSLALYAEGVKALIPHWAGQSEQNRSYIEDWFGFVRKNEEPKPVLLAHANCARLIDGGRYVGDLWLGPQVAAMLFEKHGTYVLSLWTMDISKPGEENTASKEIELEPGVAEVIFSDMFGHEKKLKAEGGKLKIKLDETPVYLVGVSPELVKSASKELRPDLWPKPAKLPRNVRLAEKMAAVPIFDGKFNDWKGACQLALLNAKVSGYDCSGTGYISWDDQFLYIGADMRDNEMFNKETRNKLYRHDSMELFVSTAPRDEGSGYGPQDFQFFIAPTSAEGVPIVGMVVDREAGVVEDVKDAKFFGGLTHNADKGWALEVAIPWAAMGQFKSAKNAKLALEMRINDADTSHERFRIDPVDVAENFQVTNPTTWSLLILENK